MKSKLLYLFLIPLLAACNKVTPSQTSQSSIAPISSIAASTSESESLSSIRAESASVSQLQTSQQQNSESSSSMSGSHHVSITPPRSMPRVTIVENKSAELASSSMITTIQNEQKPVTSNSAQEQNQEYTYAVDIQGLGNYAEFERQGANIPTQILFYPYEQKISRGLKGYDLSKFQHYHYTISHEATKQIRVFSADDSGIRTVNVNTTIRFLSPTEPGVPSREDEVLYLFYNRNGGISLATKNYAGNVEPDKLDVMLEYLMP
ncbi:hypothetical protein NHG35_08320 [Aerococcaceae bacterium NML180378]|nr:hypothetical protein [Aerococcaceae bacterium NML180378]